MPDPQTNEDTLTGASRFPHRYTAKLADQLETAWQARWAEAGAFRQPNPGEAGFNASNPKFYCLDMFPYPSGAGLHVGHPEGYTASDIISRYKRMKGFNVLHPMGWDAFGLPAEQYAIQTGVHPAETTRTAIDNFRRQLQRFGFSYDWSREFATIDPEYYKWTQWVWLKAYNAWYDEHAESRDGDEKTPGRARPISELVEMLEEGKAGIDPSGQLVRTDLAHVTEALGGWPSGVRKWHELTPDERRDFIDDHRLAYLGEQTVNWCPMLGTALANEEVIDGRSERGDHPVFRKPLRQWLFRITAYADRLLTGLEGLDWPASTIAMQTQWIGRSEGAEVDFPIGEDWTLRVFTTRPDTIGGATYMVVAPEHPLVDQVLASPAPETDAQALRDYVEAARNRSDVERQESKQKTGVFTGLYATNPVTNTSIPVWTADYVLMGYGTGAIMAVPAHDERDFDFAKTFDLPIRDVVYPRPVMAMAYYAHNAPEEDIADDERWRTVLTDLLGYVVSRSVDPDAFPQALETVRSQRRSNTNAMEAVPGSPGSVGQMRGVVAAEWRDAVDRLDAVSFDEFRERFATASYFAHVGEASPAPGFAVNTTPINKLPTAQAKPKMIEWLAFRGIGRAHVNFKLRDWLFSRQRYWGEPFPIVFDERGNHYPVADSALPVTLPDIADYTPEVSDDPKPLLAKATEWLHTTAGQAGVDPDVLAPDTPVTREANTMPGWAGSCWYYLRYCDPSNDDRFIAGDVERYWMGDEGIDLYIGGAEHAVLHLLYARFWHKILFDLGEVSTPEPIHKLFHQGMILSYGYQRADKTLVPVDEVELKGDPSRDLTVFDPSLDDEGHTFIERATGTPVTRTVCKMSKSLKNVVNPDDIIEEFGADTFRLYEMYIGPLDASQPWRTTDMVGLYRFLRDTWRLIIDEETGGLTLRDEPDANVEKHLHRTIAKVGDDIERLAFNTAIAALIEFKNTAQKGGGLTADQAGRFVRTLCPFAPHMAEELWSRLGHEPFCSHADWPTYDDAMLRDDEVEVPVQILGKVRARVMAPADADADALEAIALADDKVKQLLEGKTVRKVIAIPGRMVNIVAN